VLVRPILEAGQRLPILKRNPDGPYYSDGDERAFFKWLNQIPCIYKLGGAGSELWIYVRRRRISDTSLTELLALFNRFDVAMPQLAIFANSANSSWFNRQSYPRVFGAAKPSAAAKRFRRTPGRGPRSSGRRT
jgi:hypothetical protein